MKHIFILSLVFSFFISIHPSLQAQDLTLVKGIVTDAASKKPLYVDIILMDLSTDTEIGKFNSNSETGKYIVSLPAGKKYAVIYQAKGYAPLKNKYNLNRKKGYKQVEKNIEMLVDPDILIDGIKAKDKKNANFGN